MDLDEFLRLPVFLDDIDNYFSYCINFHVVLNPDELKRLKDFYERLLISFSNDDLVEIKVKIKKVFLISYYGLDVVSDCFIFNEKSVSDLTKKETYDNIKLLVDCDFFDLFFYDIKMLFYKYLSFNINVNILERFLVDFPEPLKSDFEDLINVNYNSILDRIFFVLTCSNFNIFELEDFVDMFCNLNDNCGFCYLNYDLLKKVISSWSDDLYSKVLCRGQLKKLKFKFLQKVDVLLDDNLKSKLIESDFEDGKIIVDSGIKNISLNFDFSKLSNKSNEYIFKSCNEYAFSLRKKENIYIFNVYVVDVIGFLLKNKMLIKSIYDRGCSIKNDDFSFDMIPYDFLRFSQFFYRDAIDFKFLFSFDGKFISNDVKRVKIKVNQVCSSDFFSKNLLFNDFLSKVKSSLNFEKINFVSTIDDFAALIVNYFIGFNSSFSIYKNNGIYSLVKGDNYTESVFSMSKFVSDINLIFYLSQLGLINCEDKLLYMILDNSSEIIQHLNEREFIADFARKNPDSFKKYVKKNNY